MKQITFHLSILTFLCLFTSLLRLPPASMRNGPHPSQQRPYTASCPHCVDGSTHDKMSTCFVMFHIFQSWSEFYALAPERWVSSTISAHTADVFDVILYHALNTMSHVPGSLSSMPMTVNSCQAHGKFMQNRQSESFLFQRPIKNLQRWSKVHK